MKKLITILMIAGLMSPLTVPAFAGRRGRSQTVRNEHSDDSKEVNGKVTAVNVLTREITVAGKTFDLSGSIAITINGTRSSSGLIKVGDQATVRYQVHTTTTIRSSGLSTSGSRSSKRTNTGKEGSIVADGVTITR